MGLRNRRMTQPAARAGAAVAMTFLLPALGLIQVEAGARQDGAQPKKDGPPPPQARVKLGLAQNDPKAFRGYTLLNAMNSKTTYLMDMEGRVVKSWESAHPSMHPARLLENGHLFRIAVQPGADRGFGAGPGAAGRIQEFTWDGDLAWDFEFHNDKQFPHHDAVRMPNGNVLMIVWDKKTRDEAIAAGRKPELVGDYVLPDSIVEVKPTGKTKGAVVWEWHLWDHLVQDHDSSKANYGDVAAHPERVDINFVENPMNPGPGPPGGSPASPPGPGARGKASGTAKKDAADVALRKAEAEKLKTIGYVGTPQQRLQRVNPDWTHSNSVDYNAELDQIVVSVHEFSEIWIIDHSTTKAEAAGHTGGRSGKGGDLLYRWGNPRVYRAGTRADQTLFGQHDAHWIPRGLPGAGHMLVFNNGGHRVDGSYSSVDELILPVDDQGRYTRKPGTAYGPKEPVWSYKAPQKSDFYAFFISGAQRLPNGNTLVCSGPTGTLFEVTEDHEVVWKYVNPVKDPLGAFGFGGGPGGGPFRSELLPGFLQGMLGLSPEQRKAVADLQKRVDGALDRTLTDAQKKTLRARSVPGPGGFAAMPLPGQIMSTATQVALRPTADQRKQLAELQKDVDAGLEKTLKDDQKERLKQMRADFLRGGPPGGPGGPPRGPGGPPGGFGGGPPGGFGGGPPGAGAVFRAYRYGPDYPGLAGRTLKPGKTVEELQPKDKPPGPGVEAKRK